MSSKFIKNIENISDSIFLKEALNTKNKPNNFFKWVNTPCSINELIHTEDFFNYLTTKIIFFHNKSPSCNDLINKRLKLLTDKVETIHISSKNIQKFKQRISKDVIRQIYIVDISNKRSLTNFLNYVNLEKNRNYAVWIRGYIEDVLDFIPSIFDGMFIFDTSKYELELIKKRLSISDKTIRFLKENQNDYASNESVLFYWNYERCKEAPSLYVNPIILGMGRCLDYRKMYNYNNEIVRSIHNHYNSSINIGGSNSGNVLTGNKNQIGNKS